MRHTSNDALHRLLTTYSAGSVLFPKVGGLVTDSGGILPHPAIIIREYRIRGV